MNFKNNILIVGGTGFIGYHLAKRALERSWKVTSISTKPPKKIRYLKKVKYLLCDITKKKSLKKNITKPFDYVVNLGGYVDHSDKQKTYKSHYIGCKNLTEIFLKKLPKAFVQIGSGGEYGSLQSPHKENKKGQPKSIYAKAKLFASIHLIYLFEKKKFPATVLRLYQAYGSRQDFNRFIPIIIKACIKNKKFPCSEGRQLRDFIHVSDVVDAILKALKSKKARGHIINIGTGRPRKVKNIIKYIKKILKGGYPQFGKIKLRKDEFLKTYPNIMKAKNKMNWSPKISFKNGLKSTIKFYNEEAI